MGKDVMRINSNLTKSIVDPGGLFTSKNKTVQAPAAPVAPAMPDPDGEAVASAKRRKMSAAKQRGGRDSTILSGETLGGY